MALSIENISNRNWTITYNSNGDFLDFIEHYPNKHLPVINSQSNYNDPLKDVKKQKLQEEKAKQSYESEKSEVESSKSAIEDGATISTNPEELKDLLEGLSTNPTLLKDFKGIKNLPEGWKTFIIQKILLNSNTSSEALSNYWNKKLKHELEQQISGYFTSEGITTSKVTVQLVNSLLQHKNCPSVVYEDFTEVLVRHPNQAKALKDLVVIIDDRPNFSEKALENLYKINFFHQVPSIIKSIATHPNAPLNVAVNYVLKSNDVSKVNEINNIKAVEQVAKITQSVVNFKPEKIAALVNNPSTSTEVLSIITNLRKDIEKAYEGKMEAIDIGMNSLTGIVIQEKDTEIELTLNQFIAKMDTKIATHQNAPVDWAVDYCVKNDVYVEEIKNPEVSKKAKEAIFQKYKEKPTIAFPTETKTSPQRLEEYRKLLLEEE